MVRKIKNNKIPANKMEKVTFILLVLGYIFGICIGSYVAFNNPILFTESRLSHGNLLGYLIYFISAIILKYSGILSGAMCTLPVFAGIQNSAFYCNYILNFENKSIYKTVIVMIMDSAVIFLLILYITIIIMQILSGKFTVKKDIRYIAIYSAAVIVINTVYNILNNIIF